jgi:hypothetical protein
MQFKMNKLSWLQIGCNLGWIKKADLNAEDQKMMEDIMQAEPLRTKRPAVKDINDAFLLVEDSMHTLSDISQKILETLEYQDSEEKNNLERQIARIESQYFDAMQNAGHQQTHAQNMKEVADMCLSYLDTLTSTMQKHNMAKTSLMSDIRKDLIFSRRILESAT